MVFLRAIQRRVATPSGVVVGLAGGRDVDALEGCQRHVQLAFFRRLGAHWSRSRRVRVGSEA